MRICWNKLGEKEGKNMIKNIIFDIGNVLMKVPSIDVVRKFFKDEKDAITFSNYIFKSEFWQMMDLGKMSGLEIAEVITNKKLVDVKNYDEVIEFMTKWFTKRDVNKDTMEIGEKLKEKGYNIFILSNISKSAYEFLLNKYNFFKITDGAIISAYEGIKKPDRKFIELVLDRYGLIAEESLLIDDDETGKTIEVANDMGIKGRKVEPNDSSDVRKLLMEYGVEQKAT